MTQAIFFGICLWVMASQLLRMALRQFAKGDEYDSACPLVLFAVAAFLIGAWLIGGWFK